MSDPLRAAIDAIGGPESAAKVCGITGRAIYRWLARGALPRTDYTGETRYAYKLAMASKGAFTAKQLLADCSPRNTAA